MRTAGVSSSRYDTAATAAITSTFAATCHGVNDDDDVSLVARLRQRGSKVLHRTAKADRWLLFRTRPAGRTSGRGPGGPRGGIATEPKRNQRWTID